MPLLLIALVLQAAASSSTLAECSSAGSGGCATSIYFDSGEGSAIRPEWLSNLDAVAGRLRTGGRLRIDAFTDRSGPTGANRQVSRQRAARVRAALLQRGVQPAVIAVIAHGEADPLIATADGVREPQNRRVDLTIIP